MEFEFNEAKSRANRDKHGIDFREAQRLWDDPDLLEIPARTVDEPRSLVIGRMHGCYWSAVITYLHHRVRITPFAGRGRRKSDSMKAKDFDRRFDAGEDVTGQLDHSRAKRSAASPRRVNVDFPAWMVESLDREARHLGVTRQAIIKVWLAERLRHQSSNEESQPEPDTNGTAE